MAVAPFPPLPLALIPYDAFVPFSRPSTDNSTETEALESICSAATHLTSSPEELRVAKYAAFKQLQRRSGPGSAGFNTPAAGLVHAQLPDNSAASTAPAYCPAAPLSQHFLSLSASVILFNVGTEDPKQFVVHENLACQSSEFVRLAVHGDWKEAKEGSIPLPEDDSEAFEIYQNWMYTHRILSSTFATAVTQASYALLVKCYALGEKMIDTDFKDAIIDCVISKLRRTAQFDINLTNLVYRTTPERSPLRRLLCEVYAWSGNPAWLQEDAVDEEPHADFMADLGRLQLGFWRGQRPDEVPFLGDGCAYHCHGGKPCYRPANATSK